MRDKKEAEAIAESNAIFSIRMGIFFDNLFNGINTPFLYYKEYLIATVGEGGQGGCYGIGGQGGGMSQSGWGRLGEGPQGGKDGFDNNGSFGTANGGGGAPGGRQTFDGVSNDAIFSVSVSKI